MARMKLLALMGVAGSRAKFWPMSYEQSNACHIWVVPVTAKGENFQSSLPAGVLTDIVKVVKLSRSGSLKSKVSVSPPGPWARS